VPSRDLNRGIVEPPEARGTATADSAARPLAPGVRLEAPQESSEDVGSDGASPVIRVSTNVVDPGDDGLVAGRVGRRRRLRGRRVDGNR
jgi:hypothetical protein